MLDFFRKLDWPLNISILILIGAGLLTLSSIRMDLFWLQLIWAGIFFLVMLFMATRNWNSLLNYQWIVIGFYLITILLLLTALFLGRPIRGTYSWITIGSGSSGFQFQPSELTKVALIILFAQYFARRHISIASFKTLLLSFLYFLLPALIILKQPDLGSVLVILSIWFGYLLVSGLPIKRIIGVILIFLAVAIISFQFLLAPYQKNRIIGFLFSNYDPLGINYNVTQSKIAIGSGGFWGRGYGQGTQSHFGFLPEAHTDFIFAAYVEEWGFLGGLFILIIFTYLIFRIIKIGLLSDSNFSRFICLGTVLMILIQAFLNLGFNLGILPVVGIPLPFLSYGGSHLLTTAILIGIIQHIAIRLR